MGSARTDPNREQSVRLIAALREPARYRQIGGEPRAVFAGSVDLLETHISWVLLAGDYAYKIKKPVNLGFLDFTSLPSRRFYCEEELRLNRRTAPALYLDVVPITGSAIDPMIGGDGTPIEFAVRMRRFGQDALFDRMALQGTLEAVVIEALALRLAQFHAGLERAGADRPYASPAQVLAAAVQNFEQIRALAVDASGGDTVKTLHAWTLQEHASLEGVFAARKREGFVRECHGDLHLGNIVMLDGVPTPFDCIEFNAAFRWIDVMNEIAFLVMDLREHGFDMLAGRFLNRYLEATGDYAGLRVLRFYVVYRALVRALVAGIRVGQAGIDARTRVRAEEECRHYLGFAQSATARGRAALVAMHGLSGSGKTTIARQLAESLQGVHIRSDVERKRLHGLAPQARSDSGLETGIYTPGDTERTYAHLAVQARHALAAGYPVIVDAAFLAARHRALFRSLALDSGVPFVIASCVAPHETLRERIVQREKEGTDASEAGLAVLERQIKTEVPLAADEAADAVRIDSLSCGGSSLAAVAKLALRLN